MRLCRDRNPGRNAAVIGTRLRARFDLVKSVLNAGGLERDSVIDCDNIVTIPSSGLGRHGYLRAAQESALSTAIRAALDLD